ncbi:MAG: DNA replication initiation control protein YabA [Clostridiales bacterium]|nr:DNA replication initiation control protein YabA [Clostridiales bacterium]
MSLSERLAQVEKNQRLLQEEIQRVRQEAKSLEEENRRLREQLYLERDGADQQATADGSGIRQNAQENLKKLHDEGFHICHLFFGRERNGECLFCRSFLGD